MKSAGSPVPTMPVSPPKVKLTAFSAKNRTFPATTSDVKNSSKKFGIGREQYGGTIIKQLRKLGSSCDWERERFTMDEGLSDAVRKVFVDLYEKGYIYRGSRMINWLSGSQNRAL